MANIIIPAEHQSAPKKDELDKAMETAASEIASGQFQPERGEMPLDIALRAEFGKAEDWQETGPEHFQATRDSLSLADHPAVKEAMARLESERDNARHSQEYLEKSQMLWELNERASRQNRWDGQQRWQGDENEEMRIGLILTPFQFLERLERVIGKGRVFLCRFGVADKGNPNTGRVALLVRAPEQIALEPNDLATIPLLMEKRRLEAEFLDVHDLEKRRRHLNRIAALERHIEDMRHGGRPEEFKDFAQVATLQWPCSSEWMVMNFDEFGVPTTAMYLGWRTALLCMIRLGVITEKEAHKAFPLGTGPAGEWYRQQLFEWRHHRVDMVN